MNAHLIRHGEVENPNHVVYADLAGFGLSARGRRQALAAGRRLAEEPLALIVASPLQRAIETAELISQETGASALVDDRLTEWKLSSRWAGVAWEGLPDVFPGELEAYLENPRQLPFSPESLENAARRVVACVVDWIDRVPEGLAFVSHQDPLHGAFLWLTQAHDAPFHSNKPEHCSITTLRRDGVRWVEVARWAPDS